LRVVVAGGARGLQRLDRTARIARGLPRTTEPRQQIRRAVAAREPLLEKTHGFRRRTTRQQHGRRARPRGGEIRPLAEYRRERRERLVRPPLVERRERRVEPLVQGNQSLR